MKRAIPDRCFMAVPSPQLADRHPRYTAVIIAGGFNMGCIHEHKTEREAVECAKNQFDHLVAAMDIGEDAC